MLLELQKIFIVIIITSDVTHQQTLLAKPDNCPSIDAENGNLQIIRQSLLRNKETQEEMKTDIAEIWRQLNMLKSLLDQKSNSTSTTKGTTTDMYVSTGTSTKPTTRKPKLACMDPWLPYEDYCFYIGEERSSWSKASGQCQSLDSELATLDDKEKNEFIAGQIKRTENYWIGGNDIDVEGIWRWKGTGEVIGPYKNWYLNDPDGRTNQNCMWYNYQGKPKWIDAPCKRKLFFVCERKM